MPKIMHFADVHLDTAHHGKINPKTGVDIVIESNARTAKHLVQAAIDNSVDLAVIPGDLVSTGKPTTETLCMLNDIFAPLGKAGIPSIIDEGNHERLFVPAMHRTPTNALGVMLGEENVDIVTSLALKHYDDLDVLMIPYPHKTRILSALGESRVDPTKGDGIVVRYLLAQIEELLKDRDTSIPLVISGHFTVDGIGLPGSEHDIANLMNEVVFPIKSFEQFDPAYVALGHIHTPQMLGSRTYYAGSTNKLTFTDANDMKAGNLVSIDSPQEHSVEYIYTPVRGMYKVDLANEEFALDLKENDVVQIHLREGESEIPKEIRKMAESAGVSLIPKTRPVQKKAIKRTVLPEKISPISALQTHLQEQGMTDEQIKDLIDKAKALGAKGDVK